MMRSNGRLIGGRASGLRMPALLLLAALCFVASLEGVMIWTVGKAEEGHASRLAQSWVAHMRRALPDLPRKLLGVGLREADEDALRDAGLIEEAFAFKLFDTAGREVAVLRTWNGRGLAHVRIHDASAPLPSASEARAARPASRRRYRPEPTAEAAPDPAVDSLAAAQPEVWRMIRAGRTVIELDDAGDADDRPQRYAEAFLPLHAPNGDLAGYVEIYLDVTSFSEEMTETMRIAGVGVALVALIGFGAPALGWLATRGRSRKAQDEMQRIAQRDLLTGLPNRAGFATEASRLAQEVAKEGESFAVICIDIDGFHSVNDLHGAESGDAVLRRIAAGLRASLRRGDILGRLGADMFGVVVRLAPDAQLEPILARLSTRCAAPITVSGRAISVSVSIGACRMDAGALGVDGGLRRAEIALQEARTLGQGQMRVFRPEMETRVRRRRQVERSIRDGILRNRFSLHYQPLVRAEDGRTRGFEALMRLTDASGKPISPGEFIPAAEDIGAIDQLGAWALHEATAAAAQWPEPLTVAVNLSVEQFRDGGLIASVRSALDASGLAPERLELEVTESLLISNVEEVEAQLEDLKALGVSLAMDDFGTGYSSLSYLWRFRFDRLKLDRSFVLAFDQKPDRARTTISAIIALGRRLDMKVTAEGVETRSQAEALVDLGCDNLQGFYFGAPMPEAQLREVMRWEAEAEHDLAPPRKRPAAFGREDIASRPADDPPDLERRAGGGLR
ncbi:diguanylate cyclase (GGDEF) domain-containing protein [Albimonas donghaensis]|uniref:Diguanylate cyclase (GGDEF) domain-containing protein n=1 Tax=Albimonas donghaensis TaxID=356660 RepID=A0A1H2SS36_9RHOB|nr:bifunctional diguanylate cyclase/phosphodiesterase [Albimonas donghaensis]SDW34337.1 diguanylate cyclase (GGDEF) domain-containing protein [Albimonas donghaensis]